MQSLRKKTSQYKERKSEFQARKDPERGKAVTIVKSLKEMPSGKGELNEQMLEITAILLNVA